MLKSSGIVFNSSISNLPILAFRLAKSLFSAKDDGLTLVGFFKFAFVAWLDKSALTLMSPPNDSCRLGKYWFVFI